MNEKYLKILNGIWTFMIIEDLAFRILRKFDVPYTGRNIEHPVFDILIVAYFITYTIGIRRRTDTDPKPSRWFKYLYYISILQIILIILSPFLLRHLNPD